MLNAAANESGYEVQSNIFGLSFSNSIFYVLSGLAASLSKVLTSAGRKCRGAMTTHDWHHFLFPKVILVINKPGIGVGQALFQGNRRFPVQRFQ